MQSHRRRAAVIAGLSAQEYFSSASQWATVLATTTFC